MNVLEDAIQFHTAGDYAQSLEFLEKATLQQHPLAFYLLAISLREGWAGKRDEKKSFKLLKECINIILSDLDSNSNLVDLARKFPSTPGLEMARELSKRPSINTKSTALESSPGIVKSAVSDKDILKTAVDNNVIQVSDVRNYLNSLLPLPVLEVGYSYLYGWGAGQNANLAVYYLGT